MNRLSAAVTLFSVSIGSGACGMNEPDVASLWQGQMDSLPSGTVMVHNSGHGIWAPEEVWKLAEDLRIGGVAEEGPASFGRIASFAVDERNRVWVLDGQAGEVRVFDATGAHVRTLGRSGEGPGEFRQPVRIDMDPDGNAWVMDPQNTRVSVIDSGGQYLRGLRVPGGFVIMPWEGGFDGGGDYYAPIVAFEPGFSVSLGRFDRAYTPLDTIQLPTDPVERASFDIVVDGVARVRAGIPFQGGLRWRLSKKGTIWALITDQYRLMEFSPDGDTLRVVTKAHRPIAVSEEEKVEALEGLRWFTEQGGKVDVSRIPDEKPPANSFFVDEAGFVWVALDLAEGVNEQPFDLFNPIGQYLGTVVAPLRLQVSPAPIVKGDHLYGVVLDELEVPYMIRARLTRPSVKAGQRRSQGAPCKGGALLQDECA